MKSCVGCNYAIWHTTKNGRLHPSGCGHCNYPYKVPQLPASMYWIDEPHPRGGSINRREELKKHCAYYQSGK